MVELKVEVLCVSIDAAADKLPTKTIVIPIAPPTMAQNVEHLIFSPKKIRLQNEQNNGDDASKTNVVAAAVLVTE